MSSWKMSGVFSNEKHSLQNVKVHVLSTNGITKMQQYLYLVVEYDYSIVALRKTNPEMGEWADK